MSNTIEWHLNCFEGLKDHVEELFRVEAAMANSELEAAVLYAMNHGFEEEAEYLVDQLRDEKRKEERTCYERWQNSTEDQEQFRLVSKAASRENFHARASVETDNLMTALAKKSRCMKDDLVEAAAQYAIEKWVRAGGLEQYS